MSRKRIIIFIVAIILITVVGLAVWWVSRADSNNPDQSFLDRTLNLLQGNRPAIDQPALDTTNEINESNTLAGAFFLIDDRNTTGSYFYTIEIPDPDVTLEAATIIDSETELEDNEVAEIPMITATVVRYLDKDTGFVYDMNLTTGEKTQITITELPFVYDAHFLSKDVFALRQVDSLGPFMVEGEIDTGIDGTGRVTVQNYPLGSEYVFLHNNQTAIVRVGQEGTVVETDNGVLVRSSYQGLQVQSRNGNLYAFPNADSHVSGTLFQVNDTTFTSISKPGRGLTALVSPDGTQALVSKQTSPGNFETTLVSITNQNELPLTLATLPADKCVWGTLIYCAVPQTSLDDQSGLPERWYQNRLLTRDSIWAFDPVTGTTEFVADISELSGTSFDVDEITLGPDEAYITVRNRRNGSLWALDFSLIELNLGQ